jgi:ubiquinone/menaquinone biosynthesis C-methylase UbiE
MPASATDDPRFWDRIARRYAADAIKDMPGYERTLERTRQLLRKDDSVLEIGCGTGTTALRLAPDVGRILGTDISREMIAIANEKSVAQGCANAEFMAVRAEQAVAGDGPFDAVLAFNLFHLVSDRAAMLDHVHRLLKPGGLLISKTPCLSEMSPLVHFAVPAMRLVGKAPAVSFFTAAQLARELETAGFTLEEQARHGSGRKDPRIFIVARRAEHRAPDADWDEQSHPRPSIA